MLHIYRQITALRRVRAVVITRKRENAERFPFESVQITPKPPLLFFKRLWFKQLRGGPWPISRAEAQTLRSTLQKINAELLHVYFGQIGVRLLPLIKCWQKPSVVSFHGADVLVDMQNAREQAATLEMLTAVQCVLVRSQSLRQGLIKLGCPPEKIRIQRTGIPLGDFPFRERAIPPKGNWRLLQACRLIEKKGVSTTLRAFAGFHALFPSARLTIAGDGPELNQLRRLASELKITGAIDFCGFLSQDELRSLFYSSHFFLHPSQTGKDGNQEGVPNSILEAMATGLPVFASYHGGIPEAVENAVTGFLVPERDHQALTEAMILSANNPQQLREIGRNAAEYVANNFAQAAQTRRLENIYLEAIGSPHLVVKKLAAPIP